jgi:hypothetical protein
MKRRPANKTNNLKFTMAPLTSLLLSAQLLISVGLAQKVGGMWTRPSPQWLDGSSAPTDYPIVICWDQDDPSHGPKSKCRAKQICLRNTWERPEGAIAGRTQGICVPSSRCLYRTSENANDWAPPDTADCREGWECIKHDQRERNMLGYCGPKGLDWKALKGH